MMVICRLDFKAKFYEAVKQNEYSEFIRMIKESQMYSDKVEPDESIELPIISDNVK